MTDSRRKFLAKLGFGAGVVGLGFNKVAGSMQTTVLPTELPAELPVELPTKKNILRLAASSRNCWVRKDLVREGNWFVHKDGARTCIDLGPTLLATSIKFETFRAVKFKQFKHGLGPVAVTEDVKSELFKQIVDEDGPYGPVYTIQLPGVREVELFCSTKSARRAASIDLGPRSIQEKFRLSVSRHESHSMGWVWYSPHFKAVASIYGYEPITQVEP